MNILSSFKTDINLYSWFQKTISWTNWLRDFYNFWRDNFLDLDYEENERDFKKAVFDSFRIDLENDDKLEFYLIFKANCTFSEIDDLPFWRYQNFIENYQEYIKEENKRNEEENRKYDVNKSSSNMFNNANKGMGNYQTPKMPSMPKI
ncbi:MAG: hypothetical protein PHV15_14635 [Thomasclavelia ramosa]|nr:hypothetical protein [Thomasclavelia ramosa]